MQQTWRLSGIASRPQTRPPFIKAKNICLYYTGFADFLKVFPPTPRPRILPLPGV